MADSRSSSHEFLGNFHRVVVFVELHCQSLKQLHISRHQHQWCQPFCILTVDVQLLGGLKMEKINHLEKHAKRIASEIVKQYRIIFSFYYTYIYPDQTGIKGTVISKSWGNNLNRTIRVWHTPIDDWWLWHFTFTRRQPSLTHTNRWLMTLAFYIHP